MFYFASVLTLLVIAPLASVAIEFLITTPADLWHLVGKWFTFWGVGVRLFTAGLMQVMHPQFTSSSIFGIDDPAAASIVREVGFGNLAIGALGLASIVEPAWLLPAAMTGAFFYALAGFGHVTRPGERNSKEQFALITDFAIAALLLAYLLVQAA